MRLGGLEAIHAQYVAHRFSRHSHDEYVIGLVEHGRPSFSYRGARHYTPAGNMFVLMPGEAHIGEAADEGGYIYRTLHPSVALIWQLVAEGGVPAREIPMMGLSNVPHAAAAHASAYLHRALNWESTTTTPRSRGTKDADGDSFVPHP